MHHECAIKLEGGTDVEQEDSERADQEEFQGEYHLVLRQLFKKKFWLAIITDSVICTIAIALNSIIEKGF